MTTQEVWVHGTSGNIEPAKKRWGSAMPYGWGLYLEGNVEDDASRDETWVHFHIPLPCLRPEEQDAPRLQKVMLKFATDCNKPGWFVKDTSYHAVLLWRKSAGGAMIRKLHIWDGDMPIQEFNDLNWQSDNLDASLVLSVDLTPERKIQHGLGISVHVRFLNQSIIDCKIKPETGEEYAPGGWDGKPFRYDDTATDTKGAILASVGCRYSAKP